MMGHGTDEGLLRTPITHQWSNLINSKHVQLLREKEWNVFIWCHANEFVEKHKLKGFATGMIISEIDEAVFCSVITNGQLINEANKRFSDALQDNIFSEPAQLFENFLKQFDVKNNNVCQFNRENIFLF